MPLDHRCYVIGSNIVPSDNIFHVIRSYAILSDHIFHVIGSDFMSLDRTSCHWIGLHVIGSNFMSLDRTSCHWIELHAIGSNFMHMITSTITTLPILHIISEKSLDLFSRKINLMKDWNTNSKQKRLKTYSLETLHWRYILTVGYQQTRHWTIHRTS